MAYAYQADLWCDDCALDLRDRILSKRPSLAASEDSAEWPQEVEDSEHDLVHNCASGMCGGTAFVSGSDPGPGAFVQYGSHLELPLSQEGYKSLQKMLNEHGRVLPQFAQEWADYYGFTWHENPWNSPLDWLHDRVRDTWPVGLQADGLWNVVTRLLGMVDSDQVQDSFKYDMESDGYFKKQGWYSHEMD